MGCSGSKDKTVIPVTDGGAPAVSNGAADNGAGAAKPIAPTPDAASKGKDEHQPKAASTDDNKPIGKDDKKVKDTSKGGEGRGATSSSAADGGAAGAGNTDSTEPWTDSDFPPVNASLGADISSKPKWQDLVWLRPSEIFKGEAFELFKGIEPSDVQQGALGDCYFLGALSAMAEHSQRIKSLFVTDTVQPSGKYEIQFYKNGDRVRVIVDDHIPCQASGRPAFSRAKGNELWVMLLEKAWAKVHGSYLAIESGNAGDALEDLTGAPSVYHTLGPSAAVGSDGVDKDDVWKRLVDAEKKKYLVNASMPDVLDTDLRETVGLVEAHVYSVLDVRELDDGAVRLLNLRNPWGNGEWKGDWSDSSDLWTSERKAAVGFSDADDGAFWMSLDDWVHYFSGFSILEVTDGWHRASAAARLKNGAAGRSVFTVKAREATVGFVGINQPDPRGQSGPHEFGGVRFEMYKQGSKPAYIESSAAAKLRVAHTKVDIPKGDLLVVLNGTFPEGARDCAFSLYSASPLEISPYVGNMEEVNGIRRAAFIAKAKEEGEALEFGEHSVAGISCRSWRYSGGFCMLYENATVDRVLNETVTFDSTNAVLSPPDEASLKVELKVEPKAQRLVHLEQDDIGEGWGFKYSRGFNIARVFNDATIANLRTETDARGELRDYGDKAPGMYCKTHQFENGVCLLYENKCPSFELHETVEFTLQNMAIVGHEGTTKLEVVLKPGESAFHVIKSVESGGFSFGQAMSIMLKPV